MPQTGMCHQLLKQLLAIRLCEPCAIRQYSWGLGRSHVTHDVDPAVASSSQSAVVSAWAAAALVCYTRTAVCVWDGFASLHLCLLGWCVRFFVLCCAAYSTAY